MHRLDSCSSVLKFEIRTCETSNFVLFGYRGPLVFPQEFQNSLGNFSKEGSWNFDRARFEFIDHFRGMLSS